MQVLCPDHRGGWRVPYHSAAVVAVLREVPLCDQAAETGLRHAQSVGFIQMLERERGGGGGELRREGGRERGREGDLKRE